MTSASASQQPAPPLQSSKKTLAEGGGVLIMGLPRSGTYSVAHALKILGHSKVFHNIDVPWDANEVWGSWIRPMWAFSPYIRETIGLPYFAETLSPLPQPGVFTKADWDDLVGREHQVIADMSVYFVAELVETYPDAQVILWQRDVEAWYRSYMGMLEAFEFHSPFATFMRWYVAPFSGIFWHTAMWYGVAGWLRAKDMEGMRANARDRYWEHFEMVRKMVRPGKLLEFHLGDGWDPLCEFLQCEVPDQPFPHLNEMDAIKKMGKKMNRDVWYLALRNIISYPLRLLGRVKRLFT
ncbi:hypothetical protein AA313_de0201454 [Arthrobotrys entomopaga]|nr:hypothetical protein AA313_de0201454 [Arthrobotrys entomopaga]